MLQVVYRDLSRKRTWKLKLMPLSCILQRIVNKALVNFVQALRLCHSVSFLVTSDSESSTRVCGLPLRVLY